MTRNGNSQNTFGGQCAAVTHTQPNPDSVELSSSSGTQKCTPLNNHVDPSLSDESVETPQLNARQRAQFPKKCPTSKAIKKGKTLVLHNNPEKRKRGRPPKELPPSGRKTFNHVQNRTLFRWFKDYYIEQVKASDDSVKKFCKNEFKQIFVHEKLDQKNLFEKIV